MNRVHTRTFPRTRRRTALLEVLALLASLLGAAAFTAAPARAASVSGPVVGLASKCMDDSGSGTADGNPIILWPCSGSANQTWTLPGDGTIHTLGKCLDMTGGSTTEGTYLDLYTCDGQARQQWKVQGTEIVNPGTGYCVDAYGGSSANGTKLDAWACGNNQANQQWTVPAPSTSSPNLLVDPGFESIATCSQTGLDGMTVPGWTITSGMPNGVCYGAPGGFPTSATPGPSNRGNVFITGGATGNSGLEQTVDVSAAASSIDTGTVSYNLNGWLGGYSSQGDDVALTATFKNASGASLGSSTLGPVTPAQRNNTTELLYQQGTGQLPVGTRSVTVSLAFTWYAGNTTDGYADNLSFTIGATIPAPSLTPPSSTVPRFDHVFVVYMENQDYENIIGNTSQAPYINSLLSKGSSLTQSYATTHPSDPNYVALAAGSLYGLTGNSVSTTTINEPSLMDTVAAAGETWKQYAQNANGNCDTTTHGNYYPDDVPFYYFAEMKNNPAFCQAHWQPLTQLTTDLQSTSTTPNFVWADADDCYDMEACGITAGDTWLSQTLPTILNSPAWTQQKSLLILTWDEGAVKSYGPSYPNRVPTIMLGSPGTVKAGYSSSERVNQYGLLRVVDKALGLSPLTANDTYATTPNDIWG